MFLLIYPSPLPPPEKNDFFTQELSREIVTRLRPKKNEFFEHPTKTLSMKENESKQKKMKENDRKCPKMKENQRT